MMVTFQEAKKLSGSIRRKRASSFVRSSWNFTTNFTPPISCVWSWLEKVSTATKKIFFVFSGWSHICRNKRPRRLIFRSNKNKSKSHRNPSVLCTPLWKITHGNPSVLCTPPFEKSPIETHRFCVLPFEKSPMKTHRFCVLPPLKNHCFGGLLFRQIRYYHCITLLFFIFYSSVE